MPKHSLEDFLGYALVAGLTIPLVSHIIVTWPNISTSAIFSPLQRTRVQPTVPVVPCSVCETGYAEHIEAISGRRQGLVRAP